MIVRELEELRQNLGNEFFAMKFGRVLIEKEGSVEEKREIYKIIFNIPLLGESSEAIINMWAVATMLETKISIPRKIQAVRNMLKDPILTPSMIEEWVRVIYNLNRIPKKILDFLAIDIRNIHGISTELRRMLGHPNPEKQFKE